MARPLRIEYPGAHCHVMNRGLERRRTFLDETHHRQFTALLSDAFRRWQIVVFAYCCMPNHYHLVLKTPRGNLSRVMRHLDGLYTQWFNRTHRRDGPLFRGRYKAILVDADRYLFQLVRYVHLNPVEAGLVPAPGAYPWTSYRLYSAPRAPDWVGRDEILAQFAGPADFERFIAEGNHESLRAFFKRRRWSSILGDEVFMRAALKLASTSREHPRAQRSPQFQSVADVLRFVSDRTQTPPEAVLRGRRGKRNVARSLAVYVASRVAGFPHPEIRRFFQLGSDSAVSQICWRAKTTLLKQPRLRRVIERL